MFIVMCVCVCVCVCVYMGTHSRHETWHRLQYLVLPYMCRHTAVYVSSF